ncbi:MAG: hypothetical protein ABIO24_05695 [Saprospiraceae bacterium]
MRRLYPRSIQDKFFLSRLLEQYLLALQNSPLQVELKTLSWESQIPEGVFQRLTGLHRHPADAANIKAEDFHILFSNIMFRYPTVKLWLQPDGDVFIEL